MFALGDKGESESLLARRLEKLPRQMEARQPRGGDWDVQQAHNRSFVLAEGSRIFQFLIRDRDTKFTNSSDEVFRSEGFRIIKTSIRAPCTISFAERFVGTVRQELARPDLYARSPLSQASSGRIRQIPLDGRLVHFTGISPSGLRQTDILGDAVTSTVASLDLVGWALGTDKLTSITRMKTTASGLTRHLPGHGSGAVGRCDVELGR